MRLYLLVLPLFLMSCATSQDVYPENWPPLRNDATCSSVSGIYENRGEMANPPSVENYKLDNLLPTLTSDLFQTPNSRIAAEKADAVQIVRRDSVIDVLALHGAEILVSVKYAVTTGQCKDGWLLVAEKSGLPDGTGNVVLGYEDNSIKVRTAADGSLIVKRSSAGAGMAFMIVPVAGSSTVYMRYHLRQ